MIKNILKKIYFFSILILNSLISLLCVIFFSSFRVNKGINDCIARDKKHDQCIIMGNGPSINDLFNKQKDHLNDKDIFAVNYFGLTEYFDDVKPKFYVMLDPGVFEMRSYQDYGNQAKKLLVKFNKINWNMIIFVPTQHVNSNLTSLINNTNINIIPFNSTPIKNSLRVIENILFRLNLGMPLPQTVINAVIFLAINLKYKNINLYGVEQSWLKNLHVNNSNEVMVGLSHFYDGPSHLLKDQTLKTLSIFLRTQANCFESHMRLEQYSKYNGIEIINHTPNSYIDAYKRKVYEDT